MNLFARPKVRRQDQEKHDAEDDRRRGRTKCGASLTASCQHDQRLTGANRHHERREWQVRRLREERERGQQAGGSRIPDPAGRSLLHEHLPAGDEGQQVQRVEERFRLGVARLEHEIPKRDDADEVERRERRQAPERRDGDDGEKTERQVDAGGFCDLEELRVRPGWLIEGCQEGGIQRHPVARLHDGRIVQAVPVSIEDLRFEQIRALIAA